MVLAGDSIEIPYLPTRAQRAYAARPVTDSHSEDHEASYCYVLLNGIPVVRKTYAMPSVVARCYM